MSHSNLSRRRFLGRLNCAAISAMPILNTLLNLKLASNVAAAAAPASDHRALVCLFLSGGCDTFNVLVPRGDTEYAEYKTVRGNIALPQNQLLALNPTVSPGVSLGVHPGLSGIQSLFNTGKAAFVANVGTLVEPVTKADYDADDGTKRFPINLYSHSDQIEQWHTSTPNVRSAKGWAGRAADLIHDMNADQSVSMNISLTGANIWQSGENTLEYTVSPGGAIGLEGYEKGYVDDYSTVPIRTRAVDSQLAFQYQHLLTQAFNTKKIAALEAYSKFNSAVDVTLPDVTFPDTYLAAQFRMVAKAIKGHAALGQSRQTFFIEYGGWDHHDGVIANQAEMLPEVDGAVKAFFDCLAAMGLDSEVTLFTASDFGRTLTNDNDGADHAWGGNHLVVGGAVNGQRIYGQYPQLYADNPLDVGRGRFIPTTSVDEYFAELALWFGVPRSDMHLVLPNLGNFYTVGATGSPLGFL